MAVVIHVQGQCQQLHNSHVAVVDTEFAIQWKLTTNPGPCMQEGKGTCTEFFIMSEIHAQRRYTS
jgi:hypothetical protein